MTGNGLGTVPLHVLTTGAKPTPKSGELGFKNEVQDVSRCLMRHAKINCPVWALFGLCCEKNLLRDWFDAEPTANHY